MQDGVRRRRKTGPGQNGHRLDLRKFVEDLSLDGNAGGAIVEFYAMSTAISIRGFEKGIHQFLPDLDLARPGMEIVSAIVEHLTKHISGLKGDILRKAAHEALLDAAGLGYGPERLNVRVGLEKFLKKRGPRKILELFLSRYVFNTIWIQVQDTMRQQVGGQSLGKSMLPLERLCVSAVKSVLDEWETEGKLEGLARKRRLGALLMRTIASRLVE
jgi:hypothetical protein